jgi:4-hydroxybenzoate polyprenyltransferase
MAEVGLLLAVIVAPILIGVVAAYLRRPWWWGAVAAICVFLVAALAPAPEEGESRVALGDVGFLVVVALLVALLVWFGAWLTGRMRGKPTSTS